MAELDIAPFTAALMTDAAESGHCEYVSGHPIMAAHGSGVAFWLLVKRLFPWSARSGLAATSAVLVYEVVLTLNDTTADPPDDVDPRVVKAATALLGRYIGGFTLGGLVSNVDVRGAAGVPVNMIAGWMKLGTEGGRYRAMIITLPLVLNNLWDESP